MRLSHRTVKIFNLPNGLMYRYNFPYSIFFIFSICTNKPA